MSEDAKKNSSNQVNLDPSLVKEFSDILMEKKHLSNELAANNVSHQANNDNICT